MDTFTDTKKVTARMGQPVTLESLKDGRLETLFAHYVSAILRNIKDPDTSATAKRTIALKLVLEPKNGREYALGDISLNCSCLPHIRSMKAGFFLAGSDSSATMQEQPTDEYEEPLTREPETTHAIAMASLIQGAVDEAFQIEVQRVVANIRDVNTIMTEKRTLTVKFTFAPSESRNYAGVKVAIGSSCSGHNEPLLTALIITVTEKGVITAREQYVEQGSLL